MKSIEEIRELFPYIKTGKIYFNHAAVAPINSKVIEEINHYLFQRSVTDIDNHEIMMKKTAEAKNQIAALLKTGAHRIAFMDNTSNGINVLAQGIKWKSGDRIILNDVEFPSNIYPFMNLKNEGVEIDLVKSKESIVASDDILAAVTEKTKLISVSHVQFVSGYRIDLEAIGNFCREKNIIFCVDAIQSVGAVEIDVEKCKIDFLSCGTQKWLMGLMGLAFIYVSDELQNHLTPKYVGWASVENAWDLLNYDLVLKKNADVFQNGTVSLIAVHALLASLEIFESFGNNRKEDVVLDNSEYFIQKLIEHKFKPILANKARNNLAGIVTVKSDHAKDLLMKLEAKDVRSSLREGMLRLSPNFYNTREEIDRVISILSDK